MIAAYGKRYQVALSNNRKISCVTRGKKNDLACGDIVNIRLTDTAEGVVESTEPRTTLLYRSNAYKSKILAANATQMIIVLATQPSFYESLLNRCLVAAEAATVKPIIVLNKCDLPETNDAKNKLALYQGLDYEVIFISAKEDISPLLHHLNHQKSVLVGQSGMGKSTIINALIPEAKVRTQAMSEVLDSGKHTTTAAHLYHLNQYSTIVDSPGLQEFGLNHLDHESLELAYREFRPFLGHCHFSNCKHRQEPNCAVINAVKNGTVSDKRLTYYRELSEELTLT